MTTFIEDELRRMFAEDAEAAPDHLDIPAIIDNARQANELHRQRQSRRVRQVIGGSILAAATIAVLSLALWSPLGEQPEPSSPSAQASPSTSPQSTSPTLPVTPRPTGALPDAPLVRCSTSYSVERLNQASAFGFDGTVVAIRPIPSDSPGGEAGYVDVTFEVNDWYAGGSGTGATVDMFPPDVHAFESTPPSYQAGTRLLVSGNSRSGADSMDQAVANSCGFTRYYDEQTANAWRDAFR